MRILMPSIVDPSVEMGGAWKSTRGLISALRGKPLHADVHVIPLPARSRAAHHTRQCFALARSFISPLPSKILFSRSAGMISSMRRILQEREFDLILINGTDLLWLLPCLSRDTRVALFAHNIEHQLFADQIRNETISAVLKPILRRDCARLRDILPSRVELRGIEPLTSALRTRRSPS